MHTILFVKYYTLCCIQPYSRIHFIACSQVGAQDVLKYTPVYYLQYAFNSTQLHIPSLLDSMLPGKLSRNIKVHISKKIFCSGGMALSEWTRSVRAVRDTPVADYSAPGVNTTRRVVYRPPIAVSLSLRVLSVSYFKRSLWRCGQL
jgi:hypothetical protein